MTEKYKLPNMEEFYYVAPKQTAKFSFCFTHTASLSIDIKLQVRVYIQYFLLTKKGF